ncbi:MAG: ABC transporter ATP-binding protein [Bacillota bacterium]
MAKTLLDIKDLTVSYGPITALKDVNLSVKEGSIVAILGANGAGKTTVLKKVSGIVEADKGSITFGDTDITETAPEKITKMGIIQSPEGRQIFTDLTVYENLIIGAFTVKSGEKKREDIIKENLQLVYETFPVLEERKNQISASLSGGEQQMLAIGRALMNTPKLLVLDEPSLGLAPMIVKDIFEIIKKLNKAGTTVLIVEQNALQTLKIADYAYVLQVGNIIKEGDADKMMNDPELIEAYLGKK